MMFRRPKARVRLLQGLAQNPAGPNYGLALCKAARMGSGTIYPILYRMEEQGLVTSYWVEQDNGNRRRGYHLTLKGQMAAEAVQREMAASGR
jgi:DNA-binding PadR family transcriptional regulator